MKNRTTYVTTVLAVSVLLCALLAQQPRTATAQTQAKPESKVDAIFAEYRKGTQPGAAVGVVQDGRVIFAKGYGYADLEHAVPITSATVFDVASVSKQFTGLAIAMLVEQGRVKLSDDIRTYIPELPQMQVKITVDHLLHHTSGLRDWPGTLGLAGWRMDDIISFDQIMRMACNQRTLNFVPGAEYSYSNTGYNLLAELVKRVTGESFRTWTDKNLFQPLGMTNSHFRDDHTRIIPNRAFGYSRQADGSFNNVGNNLTALGSSSLFSSVDDLAKWVINFDDPKVGGRGAMEMTRRRGVLIDGTTIPYAFGIQHGDYRGIPTLSHSGGWAGFATFVLHFPQQRFGVIVLANTSTVVPSRAAYRIADVYLGSRMGPMATPEPPPAGLEGGVRTEVLDRYTGLYRLGPGWYLRIRRDGSTLRTQATREAEFAMIPRAANMFVVPEYGNSTIEFQPAGDTVQLIYRGRRSVRLSEPVTTSDFAQYVGEYESTELATTFVVEARDGGLVMSNRRSPAIILSRLWQDDFHNPTRSPASVEFQRDGQGKVQRFSVRIDDRSRNILFERKR